MTLRCRMTEGRVVISKAGFNAGDPALDDVNKILDSDWDFSNLFLEGGSVADPAWSGTGLPTTNIPITIMFKRAYNFVPAALVRGYLPFEGLLGNPLGTPTWEVPGWGPASQIYNDRIVLSRLPTQGRYYKAQTVQYALFSVL